MRLLLRLSTDLTTKADRTRRRFLRLLVHNLTDAFQSAGITARVEPGWVRLVVEADDPAAADVARRVFGVHSVARVEERPLGDLEKLVEDAGPFFQPRMAGRTFAVRARCSGPAPFRGREIEVALGARLAPHGKVRLVDPEITCHVEARDGRVYFFDEFLPAWRGLPLGSEGRAVALVSGGFDSVVAAWMMLRRGVALDYVVCRLGGPVHQQGALRVLQVLGERWSYGDRPRVHVLPFEDVVERIRAAGRPALWQLLLKRFMYRGAELVARAVRGHAIVTGESVGQVSSQTLRNLHALEGRLDLPLLRPLVGFDKEEIIARSRDIGTYELSATVQEYCAIVPDKPATAAEPRWVADQEERVQVDLDSLVAARQILDLRRLGEADLEIAGLEIDAIPPGARIFDLRSATSYHAWHYPGAERFDLGEALARIPSFELGPTYVVYCEIGLKSAHLAQVMRQAGHAAFNFRGGMRRLMAYAAEHDLVPFDFLPTDAWLHP